jgi:hypothetical protein
MVAKINTDINETDINALVARLNAIPESAPPEQTANELFPDDKEGQREYLAQTGALQKALDKERAPTKSGPQLILPALPVVVAAVVPVIARCVIGGLGSAGINEIRTLVRKGRRATAEERVHSFVSGCIRRVVPFLAKRLARRFSRAIARLVLRIILSMRK